jgi:hypothetical protein
VLSENLIPYTCQLCDNDGTHNGLPLSLHLDHINGVSNDHRLENLRFLCPNCHTQTETYAGKNNIHVPKYDICPECSKNTKRISSKICTTCSGLKHRKVKRPTYTELLELLPTTPMTKIGAMFGVSDNAVRKWLKDYGHQF